jgi:mutual gliding-motility protein MglA
MTSLPLIYYWGPAGAGRATSISTLLGDTGESVEGDRDYVISVASKTIVARYSSVATKLYYRPDDKDRPEAIKPALRRLSEAVGVVFVADSQSARREHNIGSLKRLRADLALLGLRLDSLPVVFQFNKRDLSELMSVDVMGSDLKTDRCEFVQSVATKRVGVKEAVECLLRMLAKQ